MISTDFKEEISLLDTTMLLKNNIAQALKDYGAHTTKRKVMESVSNKFISRLAKDAAKSKKELRDLLRKSPAWNEELQAVVINGTRTHNPNYVRVYELGKTILRGWLEDHYSYENSNKVEDILNFFADPKANADVKQVYINSIESIAPKAYRANRKKSRIFKSICDSLGITDESAGSDFQRLFAQFADEVTGKKIDFKLFLSINPAHFITMSNPKHDKRGRTLVSCHSFNEVDSGYNCGCSGYARDNVTMIAFTVDNPNVPELLNNRKTTRQLFMYKPGNGLLLQSRMYNGEGGVYGVSRFTPLYRDLVQREISELEGVPNLWKTYTYCKNRPEGTGIYSGYGFGGYVDWEHADFDAKISIRADHKDDFETFTVGTYGLCIKCAAEINGGLFCDECKGRTLCDCCGDRYPDLITVHTTYGDTNQLCEDCCRDEGYRCCSHCGGYYHDSAMTILTNGEYVCENCITEEE